MRICILLGGVTVLLLWICSCFLPPLPVWLGGVIGVAVFILAGNFVAAVLRL